MSPEHFKFLLNFFKIPEEILKLLQDHNFTITTTNDIEKAKRYRKQSKKYYK